MSARTVRTAKAVAVGPSSPRPVAARSATPISTRLFPPSNPPRPARTRPKNKLPPRSGTSQPRSPAGCGASTSANGPPANAPQSTPPPTPQAPGAATATGTWTGPPTTELKQRATESLIANERRSLQPCARVESQDADRHLVGSTIVGKAVIASRRRLRRIKDLDLSPAEAVSLVPDTIRYTFQYREASYTPGRSADIDRLRGQGFRLQQTLEFMVGVSSIRASTANGSSRTAASGSKCRSILASVSKPSNLRMVPMKDFALSRPISSRSSFWSRSRRKSPLRCRFRLVPKEYP